MTEPLPLPGVKVKACKGCGRTDLRLPHPGPRCHRCHQRWRARTKALKIEDNALRRFGMTKRFRERLWAMQGRQCAICHRARGITKACAIDHDHKLPEGPESWRGLICGTCNRYLGWIRDDPEVGTRMSAYLLDPPAQQLLREIERELAEELIES